MADFDDVRRRLSAKDVFTDPSHEWKTQRGQWKGGCPWHDSKSGTCFTVDPESLSWKCFSCGRGGGPLEYAAELDGIGADASFLEKWEALARHTGCDGPKDGDDTGGRSSHAKTDRSGNDRSARQPAKRTATGNSSRSRQPAGAAVQTAPGGNEIPERLGTESASTKRPKTGPYTEQELRSALVQYRRALSASDRAREYIEGRGLSVETLHAYGCGYAAPGAWLEDDVQNEKGTYVHRAKRGRLVTPHTTPSGQLVNLYGRAVGPGPDWLKHRHLQGPKGLFNGPAVSGGDGPLVVCESSLDALSIIEAGHARAVAVHGKTGLPWKEMRGAARRVVIALDDDAGAEATELARAATLRGYEAHILPAGAYGGHGDPNAALQAGTLNLSYLNELTGSARAPDSRRDSPTDGASATAADDHTENRPDGPVWPPSERIEARGGDCVEASPEDLVGYWNGDVIGHLGRWIWTRPEAPMGPAGGGVYADRELHKWIASELEKGPHGAGNISRLRFVLWRLYAAFGPEDVPEALIPDPNPNATESGARAATQERSTYDTGPLPPKVQTTPATAPTENPHPGPRGIAVDTPYSEAFVHDLKETIPEWGREWRGSEGVWVVDAVFAGYLGAVARGHFG